MRWHCHHSLNLQVAQAHPRHCSLHSEPSLKPLSWWVQAQCSSLVQVKPGFPSWQCCQWNSLLSHSSSKLLTGMWGSVSSWSAKKSKSVMLENFRAGALQRLELVKKANSFYTIWKWHGVGKAFLLILELSQQQSIFFFHNQNEPDLRVLEQSVTTRCHSCFTGMRGPAFPVSQSCPVPTTRYPYEHTRWCLAFSCCVLFVGVFYGKANSFIVFWGRLGI